MSWLKNLNSLECYDEIDFFVLVAALHYRMLNLSFLLGKRSVHNILGQIPKLSRYVLMLEFSHFNI